MGGTKTWDGVLRYRKWKLEGMKMNQMRGLKTVLVDKAQLIETVKENRADHREGFDEAMIGYKAKAIELLNEHIERIKANAPEMVSVHLAMPSDHSAEYDRVIEMLLWSQDDQLELSDIEFSEYVMDEWGWKQEWTASNAMYSQS